jgi:hypothetical protein
MFCYVLLLQVADQLQGQAHLCYSKYGIMPAPADNKAQRAGNPGPMAAPATSMAWQQQQYQGQHSVLGVLDLIPDMQSFEKELTMLRQRANQVTADRLHLQPHLAPLMAQAAPATAANTAMGGSSLFGAASLVAQTGRLPKRQWLSSSGSPPPPRQELIGALPMAAAPWLEPSSANAQPSAASRPAAKKPRHAGLIAAEAEDAAHPRKASMAAATQLFLQQILADLDADQDPKPLTATSGPQFPQFQTAQVALAAPGPLFLAQFELGPVAGPTPGPVVPAPVSPAAGPVHPPQAGNTGAGEANPAKAAGAPPGPPPGEKLPLLKHLHLCGGCCFC